MSFNQGDIQAEGGGDDYRDFMKLDDEIGTTDLKKEGFGKND